MFIASTKENLFNLSDVYESLILHCGLEYAESGLPHSDDSRIEAAEG